MFLTHLHADFLAGHLELRNRAGAIIYLGRAATAEYAFTPLQTGDVIAGDTLFVGDVGRPDLLAAPGWAASDLAGSLFDSLRTKLLTLPDSTLVYPAHGAGSLCGKALSQETVSTIGEQRRSNYALQPMSRAAFVDLVTGPARCAPVLPLRRRDEHEGAPDTR